MDRDKLVPGQMPSYGDFNSLLDGVRDSSSPTSAGDSELVATAGGFTQHDYKQKGHWAKITGGGTGGRYSHVKVLTVHDGTNPNLTPDGDQFAVWGSTTVNPAVERNGLTTVPVGAIVWLMPDEFGAYHYNFTYGAGGGGTSPATRPVLQDWNVDALGLVTKVYTSAHGPTLSSVPTGAFSISGTVTVNTVATAGRTVVISYGTYEWQVTTNGSGVYTQGSLPGGAYVVTVLVSSSETGQTRATTVSANVTGFNLAVTS